MTFLGINSLTLSKFGALDIYQLQEGYVWYILYNFLIIDIGN